MAASRPLDHIAGPSCPLDQTKNARARLASLHAVVRSRPRSAPSLREPIAGGKRAYSWCGSQSQGGREHIR
eukprot:1188133-Prorocentrum_minimum.AAC.1